MSPHRGAIFREFPLLLLLPSFMLRITQKSNAWRNGRNKLAFRWTLKTRKKFSVDAIPMMLLGSGGNLRIYIIHSLWGLSLCSTVCPTRKRSVALNFQYPKPHKNRGFGFLRVAKNVVVFPGGLRKPWGTGSQNFCLNHAKT